MYSKSEIGQNAGLVWETLNELENANLSNLKQSTKLSRTKLLLAIGWLLREDKIKQSDDESRSVVFECI
ncbi:MAG: winged helix-turn-helix domain-containing protein [Bacillota bacterium]